MSKQKLSFIILLFVLSGLILLINISSSSLESSPTSNYNEIRAISLKELQKRLIEGNIHDLGNMKRFFGIERLLGFYWDSEIEDLIIFGEVNRSGRTLNFDDLVVSLRNTYCIHCEKKDNTLIYNDPSCTIDPDIKTIKRLYEINNREKSSEGVLWEQICSEPQYVKVFGIPSSSHLASVMVNADYLLKDIVNGNHKINTVLGFSSLHSMRKTIVEDAIRNNNSPVLGAPLNRFEFISGDATFDRTGNSYLLKSLPVILITEEEFRSGNTLMGTGSADPLAKKFAMNFTGNYEQISMEAGIYDTLWNAYQIFAIARAIFESEIVTNISFFNGIFNYYNIDKFDVRPSLPGRSLVDSFTYQTTHEQSIYYLYSCGGVNLGSKIRVNTAKIKINQDLMQNISATRNNSNDLYWDYILKPSERSIIYYINMSRIILLLN